MQLERRRYHKWSSDFSRDKHNDRAQSLLFLDKVIHQRETSGCLVAGQTEGKQMKNVQGERKEEKEKGAKKQRK